MRYCSVGSLPGQTRSHFSALDDGALSKRKELSVKGREYSSGFAASNFVCLCCNVSNICK